MTQQTARANGTGSTDQAVPSVGHEAPASVTVRLRWRDHDVMLTLRDEDGRAALSRLGAALDWLEAHGAEPMAARAPRSIASPGAEVADAPTCPAHGRPMLPAKRGGYFCPARVAEDDGTGRPVYCRHRAAGGAS